MSTTDMLQQWIILLVSFGYLGVLFAIAYYGDKRADAGRSIISNPYIYTCSIAVYCTGWTFYGSVGRAASAGVGFLPIYLGPTLAAIVWWFVLRKIIRLSKVNNITSIADFIASRYGKSAVIGGLVTVICIVGIMPYIALQLKAISSSFNVLFLHNVRNIGQPAAGHDTALYVALVLAAFSILFGTRHIDVTERHEGMVAAIAFESIVKLLAFSAVGIFVTYTMFDGPADLFTRAASAPETKKLMTMDLQPGGYASWLALTFISMTAIMFLPRQFQILVVENVNEKHVRTASWLFPLYLLAINLFVLPIALSGLMFFHTGAVDADMLVLSLPLVAGEEALALFVFIGGLSAATGMVIVETIALSTMLCNDLLMPVLLRLKLLRRADMGRTLLFMRRGGILLILLLGYVYFRLIGESYALVSIGLVSFAAAAQFAPAILLGIYWKGANRSGALAGLAGGFAVWAYTLLLPSFARSGWIPMSIVEPGPFGLFELGPYHLLSLTSFDPITHSVFWSMLFNVGLMVGVSLFSRQAALDQLQAAMFVDVYKKRVADTTSAPLWYGKTRVSDLKELITRMIGPERAESAFRLYSLRHALELDDDTLADESLIAFAERELAGTVGAASARVMVSSIIEGEALSIEGLMKVLDETSQVIEYSHQLEQKSRELEAATSELKRTNERLKELDRMKDEFVSTVSHELRTPLTSIRAFSEILQDDGNLDPQQRQQLLRIVVKETERLTRLVNQVLDFTKIESGSYQWAHEKLDLVSVVQEATAATSQLSHNKNIIITRESPQAPVLVFGDNDRLVQVIINLLSNAIKYCAPDTGKVHILLSCRDGQARIEVIDNGPGIEAGERERIFEKFHQLGDSSKSKPHGTGLGLAICKTIIENHDGRIWVESNDWNGSSFVFTLPLLTEYGECTPAPATDEQRPGS
jgi:Na+/proline symporter/nitrogen-specific signal transduction histidine kinase